MSTRDRRGHSFRFEPPKPLPEEIGPPIPLHIVLERQRRYMGEEGIDVRDPVDIATEREEERRNGL